MVDERNLEAGRVPAVDDPHLQKMLDKDAVREVMLTYCRALDRLDEELLRSAFWADSTHNMGFVGPSNDPSIPSKPGEPGDFSSYAIQVLNTHHRTHHHLANIFVEVEGSDAYTEAYFTAFHRMKAVGTPGAADNAWDTEMDFWVAGRYMDRMQKRDNVWRITHRTGLIDWQRIEAPSSAGFNDLPDSAISHRGDGDLVFRRRTAYAKGGEIG